MTALHDFIAAENDLEGLRDLLRAGENPNSQDRSGQTPLHIAVLQSESNPEETDQLVLVAQELIHYGADVNQGNSMGKTPLHFAVSCRNYKMIETLLRSDADINQKDYGGSSALHFATTKRRFGRNVYDLDLDVVKLLLKYNPEIDIRNRNGETALMLAVQNENFLIVRELLKGKASGNLQDVNGSSAMHYALTRPEVNVNIVSELMSHGCSFIMSDNCVSPITSYFWGLLNAPRTEVEKSKFVFRLYVLDGNYFDTFQQLYIMEISRKAKCQLPKFILLCHRELEQMKVDTLAPNYSVHDIALRGTNYNIFESTNHIPLKVFDKVLEILIRRQYPIYCDLIVAGICSPYINEIFAEKCCKTKMDDKYLNSDVLYEISSYLSNFDMLNMMIACSGGWRRLWYLPRFTYNTRCSVS